MTLDISKFITNSVRNQAKIHHLDINAKAVKVGEIPESISKLITKDYGDKYLLDADYVAFFWGPIIKDDIDKLFNVVDKALGKSANKLTNKDFKKISYSSSSQDDDASSSDEDNSSKEDEKDDEKEDVEEVDVEEDVDDEQMNEDDKADIPEVDDKPSIPNMYLFLKITSK